MGRFGDFRRVERGLAVITLLAVLQIGCGRSGPRTVSVSGTVTWDGKPIQQGSILFVPLDKSLGTEGGVIKDGRFEAKAKEGKNQVQITALDIGPNTEYVEGYPIAGNFIPPRYNDQSELEVDVTAEEKTFEFPLRSK